MSIFKKKKKEPEAVKDICKSGDYIIGRIVTKRMHPMAYYSAGEMGVLESSGLKGIVTEVKGDCVKIKDEWYPAGSQIGGLIIENII